MSFEFHDFGKAMDAVADLELSIIEHPQLTAALEALAKLRARACVRKNGRGLKARALLLMGQAGAGKSTVLEVYNDLNPEKQTDDGVVKPVLVVEVPATPTKRALVAAILSEMGYAADRTVNSFGIIEEITEKAKLLGVEMIILDEAHHILAAKDLHDISEFLKSLLNRAGVGIVLAGLPNLEELRSSPQFDRRLAPDVRLRAYDWTNKAERFEFLVFLNTLETDCVHLPERSDFAEQTFARRLYAATRGEIGLVTKYISQALLLASRRQLPRIDLQLLAEVDAAWHPPVTNSNEIAFDVDLGHESDADLETLVSNAKKVPIDKKRNPFACEIDQLQSIWNDRVARPERFITARQRTGKRARGTGPDEPKAFS
jgi:DNA transposition AAA+ family ATPase